MSLTKSAAHSGATLDAEFVKFSSVIDEYAPSPLVRNFLLGGAGVGGAAGLITLLARHYNESQRLAKGLQGEGDDDVLYIDVPKKPGEKAASGITEGELRVPLGITGGALAAGGAYGLLHHLYDMHRRNKAKQEMEEAQQVFQEALGEEADAELGKMAHVKLALRDTEVLGTLPLTAMLLAGLGSGLVTKRLLSKYLPNARARANPDPERPRFAIRPDDVAPEEENDAAEKQLQDTVAMGKVAGDIGLDDLLACAATEGLDGLRKAAAAGGCEGMFEYAEKYDGYELTPGILKVAAAALVRDLEIGPMVKLASASRFYHLAPTFMAMADGIADRSPELTRELVKMSATSARLSRASADYSGLHKHASILRDLDKMTSPGASSSGGSITSSQSVDSNNLSANGEDITGKASGGKDPINSMLEASHVR